MYLSQVIEIDERTTHDRSMYLMLVFKPYDNRLKVRSRRGKIQLWWTRVIT
jgi:hypothetical protein